MEEIPLDDASRKPSLSDVLYEELKSTVRGEAYRRDDPRYAKPFSHYFMILLTVM